jgi:hypothetical protein
MSVDAPGVHARARAFHTCWGHTASLSFAMGVVLMLGIAFALLPLGVSFLAYRRIERRHRHAWTSLTTRRVRLGSGPYRTAEVASTHSVRAPRLVRAAALGCIYWGWFCTLAWLAVASALPAFPQIELLALAGIVLALATARAGLHLARRDDDADGTARRIACWSVVLALVVFGIPCAVAATPGGNDALDWVGAAAVYAVVTTLLAALLLVTIRRHARDFARAADHARGACDGLPGWLARVLSRRNLQRRANFLASASHTIPGA